MLDRLIRWELFEKLLRQSSIRASIEGFGAEVKRRIKEMGRPVTRKELDTIIKVGGRRIPNRGFPWAAHLLLGHRGLRGLTRIACPMRPLALLQQESKVHARELLERLLVGLDRSVKRASSEVDKGTHEKTRSFQVRKEQRHGVGVNAG